MKEIQLKELQRITKFIEALGCKYKIITSEGEEFGDLEVVVEKKRTRTVKRPYGELVNWYRPLINLNAAIGSVQEIDCTGRDVEAVRSAISAHLSTNWGKKTYTTNLNKNVLEILRTA